MKTVFASKDVSDLVSTIPQKRIEIYSYLPCDRAGCACQEKVMKWKREMSNLTENQRRDIMGREKFFVCPQDKKGMNRYKITCNNCGELLGLCWASDNSLEDWCDFHYAQWTDGTQWHGCLTPHISPITQKLCLECCCGQDTRDFRANMKLPYPIVLQMEEKSSQGRDFGKPNSKFKVSKVSNGMLAFN